MIFEKDSISFNILDVIMLDQENINKFNLGRNFDALSYRFKSNTVLKCKNREIPLKSRSLCYVPAVVDYTRKSKRDKMIVIHFNCLNYFTKNIEYIYPLSFADFEPLFEEIFDLWNKKESGYRHKCAAILNEIFYLSYMETKKENEDTSPIKNSIVYINNNYLNNDISVKEAAAASNISEVYFRKLFKERFGVSPKSFIITSRIRHAVGLIENGYYSLSEIAEMSGFNDYKYFSTEFSRIMGVAPSKYRYNFKE